METSAFVDAVRRRIEGHPPDRDRPVIMENPQGTDLHALVAAIGSWAGQHRNLAAGGFVDPTLTERTGLPLVEPFGAGELLEMRGWGYRHRWIGCGLVASPHGPRTVAVIAHREDPASAGFPEGATWAEKLCIVTGWEPTPGPRVDWPAIEADLGTRLPTDYKEIVDLFGAGSSTSTSNSLCPAVLESTATRGRGTAPTWHPADSCLGAGRNSNRDSCGRRARPTLTSGPLSRGRNAATSGTSTAEPVSSSCACSQTSSWDTP
ncbi:hypothetical protein [Streptomyces sp. 1222.5]|uniref:hypothetical protein n=1 Tax=Streptomyces sp. 1222.5 TaxID=1881026 RepID=UPI003D737934